MNLFELTLRLKGFPIAEAKKRLQEIQAIPEKEYETYVYKLREDIFRYHLRENPSYKTFAGTSAFETWEAIPVLQKSDLQRPLAERLSNGFSEKNSYVNKTSGSSGHPFIFAKDKFTHALTWATILNRYGWHDLDFSTSLEARFYGIPLDAKGYRKERLKDKLSNRYRFPIFDLSDAKMEDFLQVFRKRKFDYINGYTSSVVLFAKYLHSRDLHLKDICPSLRYCIVTSEMLFENDKKLLETTFGVPVINEYGASELDLIAFTNADNDFIVNSETLFVEILDEHNKPVANGFPGRIIITSLYNRAHPMIRYDIGDLGILAPESTLKKPILQQLIGRTNDIARLPSGKTVPGLTFYYVTKSVIEDDGNVKEFIIEQTALDTFLIRYVSERELTLVEIDVIKRALFDYLENDLNLLFNRVAMLDRSSRGKLKQFISTF
ncbi:phenylacetate-CoA ligase [Ulvibacter sp. MAR_2010_11]|uniref:phenylacetate--CoA ligase family protein n=1 Tax=Ulvibacter sp. MAR_2010_11 TaxID=1250229 RepID=UPI000C2C092D|nr:phenylacetate--CoA ligase family protein [Ulvibacter sp. MAR_2010_11]PKA82906.1 phenylacetate-CoA ligase [Ulvibacter sp. MAR_2010_11]